MNYVSWAAMYEGTSDRAYFEVLIPRAIEWLTLQEGKGTTEVATNPVEVFPRESPDRFAQRACRASQSFHLCFIHGDTGGRALEAGIEQRTTSYCRAFHNTCQWPPARCVIIAPRKETEAWVLADPQAVASALGYPDPSRIPELPQDARQAESLTDPKATLQNIISSVKRGKRTSFAENILPAIAQRQNFAALFGSQSFTDFGTRLRSALVDMRVIE